MTYTCMGAVVRAVRLGQYWHVLLASLSLVAILLVLYCLRLKNVNFNQASLNNCFIMKCRLPFLMPMCI